MVLLQWYMFRLLSTYVNRQSSTTIDRGSVVTHISPITIEVKPQFLWLCLSKLLSRLYLFVSYRPDHESVENNGPRLKKRWKMLHFGKFYFFFPSFTFTPFPFLWHVVESFTCTWSASCLRPAWVLSEVSSPSVFPFFVTLCFYVCFFFLYLDPLWPFTSPSLYFSLSCTRSFVKPISYELKI